MAILMPFIYNFLSKTSLAFADLSENWWELSIFQVIKVIGFDWRLFPSYLCPVVKSLIHVMVKEHKTHFFSRTHSYLLHGCTITVHTASESRLTISCHITSPDMK